MSGDAAERYYSRRVRLLSERRARRQEWDWMACHLEDLEIVDEVGPGWRSLVLELHAALLELDPGYRLYEVAEDLGGLVFIARVADERAAEGARLIAAARTLAFETCENCGHAGCLRPERRQPKTLCRPCWSADRATAAMHGERHADVVLARLLSSDDDHPSVAETLTWLDELDAG